LRFRLILTFIAMIALAITIGGIGIYGIRNIVSADQRLYNNYTLPLMSLERICSGFQLVRVNLYRIGTVDSAGERKADIAAIAGLLESVDSNTRQYDSTILTAEGRRLFVLYTTPLSRFKGEVAGMLDSAKSGDLGLKYRQGLVRSGAEAEEVQAGLDGLVNRKTSQAKSIAEENGRVAASSTFLAVLVLGSGVLLAILLCVAILRFVMRSVGGEPAAIAAIAESIAAGTLDAGIFGSGRATGIRKALADMAEKIAEIVGAVQEAARQVADGSDQISSAAQIMSQGATEQAASGE